MTGTAKSPIGRLLQRHAEQAISDALQDTRVVLVNGARQSGKSTLLRQIARADAAEWRDLDVPVIRPKVAETTSLGAAYAAGLTAGYWDEIYELRANWRWDQEWTPAMSSQDRERGYRRWKKAVQRTLDWLDPEDDE